MPLVVSDLDHKLSSFSNNAISITTSFDVSATFQLGSIAWFKMFQTCNYSSLKKKLLMLPLAIACRGHSVFGLSVCGYVRIVVCEHDILWFVRISPNLQVSYSWIQR